MARPNAVRYPPSLQGILSDFSARKLVSMNHRSRQFIATTLSKLGLYPALLTPKSEIVALLRELHPIDSGRELIRVGPAGDGGYLVPDDLAEIKILFSPGVSFTSGFEKSCAELGMRVFLADASVEGPAETHPLFHFRKKFLGAISDEQFMTMDDWVREANIDASDELMLQMDIEGSEYETLLSMSDALMQRFRVLVIEFHRIHHFFNKPFFDIASRAFKKVLQTHVCVHIHPNNSGTPVHLQGLSLPPDMEFTFLRRDRTVRNAWATTFPHRLDADNTQQPHLRLPECWFHSEKESRDA